MNNGLLGWPLGRMYPAPDLLGFPPQRRAFKYRPRVAETDILGTTQAVAVTSMVVALPTNYAAGDLVLIALKASANATPSAPAGWATLQSGAQGSQGQILAYRVMDATEGATATFTIGTASTFSALALRIPGAGDPTFSTPNTGNGTTPTLNGAAFASAGQLPCLAILLGTSLNQIDLDNIDAGCFTTVSGATKFESWVENLQSTRHAWVMWADIVGTRIDNSGNVQITTAGTWSNFTCVAVVIPPQRRFAATQS